jgi:hypothetical protein
MRAFLLLVLFFNAHSYIAQVNGMKWSMAIDGHHDVDITDTEVDNEGNSYFSFIYTDDIDIPGISTKFPYAPHVFSLMLKVNPQGKAEWAQAIQSINDNRIRDIEIASNGDLIVTGFGDGRMTFPSTDKEQKVGADIKPNGYYYATGIYVARYSPKGKLKWLRHFTGSWGEGIAVTSAPNGKIYLSIYIYNTITDEKGKSILEFKRTEKNYARNGILVFDEAGELLQTRPFGYIQSSSYIPRMKLATDASNNLIIGGTYYGNMVFSEKDSLTSIINNTISLNSYLVKYDDEGKLLWLKNLSGDNTQWIKDIEIAKDQSVYFCGEFSVECEISDGVSAPEVTVPKSPNGTNYFHGKLFPDGSISYTYHYVHHRNSYSVIAQAMGLDDNGEMHIVGTFNDTLTFNNDILPAGYHNNDALYSLWKDDKLLDQKKMGLCRQHFMSPNCIDVNGLNFAGGGLYAGDENIFFLGDKKIKLKNRDYGRATFIFGGSVPKKDIPIETIAEAKENKQKELIEYLKPIIACLPETESAAPDVWTPLLIENEDTNTPLAINDTPFTETQSSNNLANENSNALTNVPCNQVQIDMQAVAFPNPTRADLNIKVTGYTGVIRIEMFNPEGQLVYSKVGEMITNEETFSLNTSNFASATYLLLITTSSHQKVIRVAVAR